METSHQSKRKCIRSTTNILDLNDHVLRETFRHLNASDLCTVADVCSAFKWMAQAEFSLRFTGLCVNDKIQNMYYFVNDDYNYNTEGLRTPQLAPMLRNFGTSVNAIYIHSYNGKWSRQILKLIAKYSDESLNALHFHGINFTRDAIHELRPVLSRLQTLTLVNCCHTFEMFSLCSELQTLSLWGAVNFDTSVALPKLRSLVCIYISVSNDTIGRFLSVNPQLREIDIGCRTVTSDVLPIIVKCIPQLEKLKLSPMKTVFERNLVGNAKHLTQLTALKSLEIDCSRESISCVLRELAAACIPLESLNLRHFWWDEEFLTELSKWKKLTKLGLEYANLKLSDILLIVRNLSELTELELTYLLDSNADLVEIVRWAPKLQKLTYATPSAMRTTPILRSIDLESFMNVRNVVANRQHPCPLALFLCWVELKVPEETLKASKDVLTLTLMEGSYEHYFYS